MRTFLVTGGAGFIGSHIAQALVERGDRVRVLDNLITGHLENLDGFANDVEFTQADLNDTDVVSQILKGVDCVFHQAALASVPRSLETPLDTNAACVTGTVNLLNQARHAGVRRVVYAGSSSAYGDQPYSSKRETDPPLPLSPYAAAKLAAEMYCRAFFHSFGLETVCLRYFNVFGPRQDPGSPYSAVIPLFVTAMLAGKQPTIYGDGQQSRDFTYVENVVSANLLAADKEQAVGRTFNAASGGSISLLQLIENLNDMLGTDIAPIHEENRTGDVRDSMADITLARNILGYEPHVSFEEGLRRTVEFYHSAAPA